MCNQIDIGQNYCKTLQKIFTPDFCSCFVQQQGKSRYFTDIDKFVDEMKDVMAENDKLKSDAREFKEKLVSIQYITYIFRASCPT